MNKIKDFLNKNKIYFEVISSCMFVLIGYFQYQISSEQTNIANSQIVRNSLALPQIMRIFSFLKI